MLVRLWQYAFIQIFMGITHDKMELGASTVNWTIDIPYEGSIILQNHILDLNIKDFFKESTEILIF